MTAWIAYINFVSVTYSSYCKSHTKVFLGRLHLVTNMSRIADQQFIHYLHPLAIAIIAIIVCLL